ncbi:hypothetical protein [Novosphingobium umbonatum]|uniref:hypothetical protein n=1 Tax=Novosphingobium umbonatum TaxID=1908524 RepID=UPI0013E407E6|nr:hypothetical protein [Novosphingobium umbonatum]
MTATQQVNAVLQEQTNLLAQKARIDDRLRVLDALVEGVNLGGKLAEEKAEEAKTAPEA